jgi:hypothetical protein
MFSGWHARLPPCQTRRPNTCLMIVLCLLLWLHVLVLVLLIAVVGLSTVLGGEKTTVLVS